MKIVRNNVFETNSSSSHVLALGVNIEDESVPNNWSPCNKDGIITVEYKFYGWSGDPVLSIKEKINYLFAQKYGFVEENEETIRKEYTEFLKKIIPNCKEVKFINHNDGMFGVDHQSQDLFRYSDVSDEDFLLKPYVVIIANDNQAY